MKSTLTKAQFARLVAMADDHAKLGKKQDALWNRACSLMRASGREKSWCSDILNVDDGRTPAEHVAYQLDICGITVG